MDDIRLTYVNVKDSTSQHQFDTQKLFEIENLTVLTPTSKALLIRDFSLTVCNNEHLLNTGPSGSEKTSLLRAIAGLWRTSSGSFPFLEDVLGSEVVSAQPLRLGYLLSCYSGLDTINEWSSVLSLGEQQRLAFAPIHYEKNLTLDANLARFNLYDDVLYDKNLISSIKQCNLGSRS